MESQLTGDRQRKFTDAELRSDLAAGMRPVDIAAKHRVSKAAVSKRVNRLGLTTSAAVIAPGESKRHVHQSLNAMEQLTKSLYHVNLLMDACHEWLKDADDPSRYDIGPRSGEVTVTYEVEIKTDKGFRVETRKKPLSQILEYCEVIDGERVSGYTKWESKHADPRDTILKTAAEARSTVNAAADIARMLADIKAMEAFRNCMISEIAKEAPEVASRIAEAVRRSIVLSGAYEGLPGARVDGA